MCDTRNFAICDLHRGLCKSFPKDIVVAVRNVQELHSSCAKVLDRSDDIKRPKISIRLSRICGLFFPDYDHIISSYMLIKLPDGDMLDPSASVIVDVLLDLRFLLPGSRLVDRHLDLQQRNHASMKLS